MRSRAQSRNEEQPADDPPGWWLDAQDDPALRARATLDVLTLAAQSPWHCTPGSLAEIAAMARGA